MNISELSLLQLKKAVHLKERIAKLESELAAILGTAGTTPQAGKSKIGATAKKKRVFSPDGLARIRAAQKKRWAKAKAAKSK